MCGIYGLVDAHGREVDPTLRSMAETLVHRGPDGDGHAVSGWAGLGCRRLAIIDVAGGTQPLRGEDGVLAVCNGELYNHAAVRSGLLARGHRFRTGSDAEILPHLYEERGAGLLDAVDGMFGLAVWDAARGRLVLARDRMGEKPLYWASTPGGLVFASEPKALFASGRIAAEPDWTTLSAYLRSGWVSAPASAFAGVAQLPPGGRLVLEGESLAVDRYWEVAPLLAAPPLRLDAATAARLLREHLERAVGAALVSDVPVGIFLSGGLDSAAIAALARPHLEGLSTFSLGFELSGFDEREHAAVVARALGAHHRALTITPSLFLEGVRDLTRILDEPLADPALVPTYLLSRFARRDVKVVLVGEGSDELFAGYPTYIGGVLADWYSRLPAPVRRALGAAAPALGAPAGNTTPRYMLRLFLESAGRPAAVRHRAWTGCLGVERLMTLARADGPLAVPPDPHTPEGRTPVDALLALDLAGYLPDDLLVKLDRAAMAASLEGRAPFLDHRLVEFAARLPVEYKLRGLTTKRVLRAAVGDLVPASILRRVKHGLTVPLASWLAGPLLSFARDTLGRLDPHVFRPRAVRALLEEHTARRRDNRRELWALIMFQLWHERWIEARPPRTASTHAEATLAAH